MYMLYQIQINKWFLIKKVYQLVITVFPHKPKKLIKNGYQPIQNFLLLQKCGSISTLWR